MGEEPEEIVILGVQPAVISLGSALSPAVESRLPALVEIVLCEVMRQSRSTIGH
jgi:hypothetical protein